MFQQFPVLLFLVLFLSPALIHAQSDAKTDPDWSVLMQKEDANPEEIRVLFEARWEGRERIKGSGYKQVERWLHLMDGRTNDAGTVLDADATLDAHRAIQHGRRLVGH